MADSLDALLAGRPTRTTHEPRTARVVRVAGGTFVVPYGSDPRHPIGPCRGPAVEVGDEVLLVWTEDGAWALSETSSTGGGELPELPDLVLLFENGLI